jgi:molybdopterin-binding protein
MQCRRAAHCIRWRQRHENQRAHNKLQGKIIEVKKGATTAHVRLEIAPGQIISASITNEAVEELGLKLGAKASAVIKASDVMIAID